MARGNYIPKKMSDYTEDGLEIPDSRPVEAMLNRQPQESLQMMVARLVRNSEYQRDLAQAGYETFEDSNDFGPEDEDEFQSPYEAQFITETMLHAEAQAAKEEEKRYQLQRKVKAQAAKRYAKSKAKEVTPSEPIEPKAPLRRQKSTKEEE